MDSCLCCLEGVQAQIDALNSQLLDEFHRRPDAQLIATIPGIGFYSALLIHAEIDDISKFPNPEKLSAYSGLVPTVSQSASSVHYGGVSKEGSAYLRWILTEAVYSHIRFNPDSRLSEFDARIARAKGQAEGRLGNREETRPYHLLNAHQEAAVSESWVEPRQRNLHQLSA